MISIEQLNKIRLSRKVRIVTLAKELHLSRQQCTNLLAGDSKIRLEQFTKMCEIIGVDTDFTYVK